ncbi:MAG: glycolate oxidase subunit GlcF [Gammaproteobacteria bacterium]|nr:glycolate oxidase subunit GlcF [Gammaproteobacteria bacterium]MBU2478771.1 glycolate oxidase subunit GlcF [Gammaproteobacteria bacterium]
MQTTLTAAVLSTPEGQEADAILRSCVHCGFCTATCPTYQLLGDELDGPRGRIYLIKQMLEGQPVTRDTQIHLDRCLTCRACETTCPSGVRYGRLADIGRGIAEQRVARPLTERVFRRLLRGVLPHPNRFGSLLRLGQHVRPLLPKSLRTKIPPPQAVGEWPTAQHTRRMLVLAGCAQSSTTPNTNAAAARVLDRLGISLITAPTAGCCGALSHHLSAETEALNFMRRNIDAWWPYIEQGIETIVMTASGCGVMVKEYGPLLAHDPGYADKAARISALTRDLSEVLAAEDLTKLGNFGKNRRIAVHAPCTLQHGQNLPGAVEGLLTNLGFELTEVRDSHLCCGSAGSYSLLQPKLSQQLRDNKLDALQSGKPELIVTANVGCQLHLASGSEVPVRHWIELLDD